MDTNPQNAKQKKIWYEQGKVKIDEMMKAINKAGYKALDCTPKESK